MEVYLNYRLACEEQNYDKITKFFNETGREVNVSSGILYAYGLEENYDSEEPVDSFYIKTAISTFNELKKNLTHDFALEGTIDTSSTAGEYMDFEIKNDNDKIIVRCSDWYIEGAVEEFDNYEEFYDSFFECTKEEYESIQDSEFVYILETKNGDVLSTEIPLHEVNVEV